MPEAISEAVAATLPLALFLTAALSISADAERHGVARVAAGRLAGWGRGDARLLYGLVCLATLVLTAAISLDGAVILLVPVVNTLHQRYRVPLRPLFLGCVVVANASSLALPQGNPTNLVVIQGLGVDPVSFSRHTAVPALVATAVVVIAVAVLDRGVLNGRYNASGGTVGGAGLSPAPVLAIAATTVGNVAALALGAPRGRRSAWPDWCCGRGGRCRVPAVGSCARRSGSRSRCWCWSRSPTLSSRAWGRAFPTWDQLPWCRWSRLRQRQPCSRPWSPTSRPAWRWGSSRCTSRSPTPRWPGCPSARWWRRGARSPR